VVVGCLAAGAAVAPLPAAEGDEPITVMSRNLYLGADIGVALDVLPDLPAAGDLLWEQVRATDWPTRVERLASEIVQFAPDVIGLQESARWVCRPSIFGSQVDVLNFTEELLAATSAAGADYVVAQAESDRAENQGFKIGPLPGVTMEDPETFQPLFGQDSAACGFAVNDVLLVRAEHAQGVQRAGTSEYEDRENIVPTVLALDRGYAWADIALRGAVVRFVTTHLESQWSEGEIPIAARQAKQLVADLAETTGPLVVMGDFNSDPRDPRGPDDSNPADQPVASPQCPPQPDRLTVQDSRANCSAYWTMRKAGYISAGPDDFDPAYATYGASALLAGPDPERLAAALAAGNAFGFTDRIDFVFIRNGVRVEAGEVTGQIWPFGPAVWPCDDPEQISNTAAASAVLVEAGRDAPPEGAGLCLPSDHAGVVVTVAVDAGASVADDPPPISHDPFRLVWWHLLVGLGALIVAAIWWRRRRRRHRQPAAAGPPVAS
jgi:endonuclease/exonuclease/phosphatase family metal-dependent hydrolase